MVELQGRRAQWLVILGSGAYAVLIGLADAANVPVSRWAVYPLAVLPGLLTFIVWRSLLAVAVVTLLPMYFAIAQAVSGRPMHAPAIALDARMPVWPAWTLVYASLYIFSIVLPLLVLRDRRIVHRAMQAYLAVMLAGYAGFLLYPTSAPRASDLVAGEGFHAWLLRGVYAVDAPYNCFPSLHVAYSFVAAFACYRVHRQVGLAALAWAALIAVSTVYTKQHYVVDVVAGALLALAAYAVFLRRIPRTSVPEDVRRAAPGRAGAAAAAYVAAIAVLWLAYSVLR